MTTLTQREIQQVDNICHVVVARLFASFHNPKFRGDKFSWNNFPNMMESYCMNQVFMANIANKNNTKACEYAAVKGKEFAEELVKIMTE